MTLRTYVDQYLREGIKEEAITRNLENFARFLDWVTQMNGETLNYSKPTYLTA